MQLIDVSFEKEKREGKRVREKEWRREGEIEGTERDRERKERQINRQREL